MYSIKDRIKEFFEPFAFALLVLILGTITAVHWAFEKIFDREF
ncbi:MAG: hypothetical protein ACRC3H_19275 [Lachnospiraceae bacterium]